MRIDSETGEPILTANEERLENERLDAEDRADRAEEGLGEILDCIETIIEAAERIQVICGGGANRSTRTIAIVKPRNEKTRAPELREPGEYGDGC